MDFTEALSPRPCGDDCILTTGTARDFGPFLFRTNVMPNPGDPTEKDGTLVGGAFAIPRRGEWRYSRIKVNFSFSADPTEDLTLRFSEQFDTFWAKVTHNPSGTWVIEPLPTEDDVAKLMTSDYQPSKKGRPAGHDEGDFHMPFRAVVTLP